MRIHSEKSLSFWMINLDIVHGLNFIYLLFLQVTQRLCDYANLTLGL